MSIASGGRAWIEPTITRHESMVAMTLHPIPAEAVELAVAASMVMMQIGGSQGMFPGGGGPEAPPEQQLFY
jgi:hypothetical protein